MAIDKYGAKRMNSPALWFALQTKAKCEWTALECLTFKGYECLLPSYKQKRQWADRVVEKELPLFPSYLFCRFNLHSPSGIGRVVSTPGVWRIVSFGGKPAAVVDDEIQALARVMATEVPRGPSTYIPVGVRIRIDNGPLAGIEGIRLPNGGNRKLVLSVALLQRSVAVTLSQNTIVTVLGQSPTGQEPEDIVDIAS